MAHQLLKKILFKGIIITETGLHIGGSDAEMNIGGIDKAVIIHPITGQPYIPGSSLKGKMRSLIELRDGHIGKGANDNGPTNDPSHLAAQLFGLLPETKGKPKEEKKRLEKAQRPSKIIVRDGKLLSDQEHFGLHGFTEVKTEVAIDRITSKAVPRKLERVPAGVEFSLELVLNIFREDENREEQFIEQTLRALELVEDDYLGGSGTRGSGKVKFRIDEIEVRDHEYYRSGKTGDSTALFGDLQKKFPKLLKQANHA